MPRTPLPDPRLWALRTAFRTVGHVAPGLAARCAEELFCRPPRQLQRPREERFIAEGRRFAVPVAGRVLSAWEWGSGPTVIAVHGWGSRAGRFQPLGEALVAAGFRLVAYDAPAHGTSPGRRASLPEFAEALGAVAEAVGPVHGLVGHSLGAAAVAVALRQGLAIRRVVLIAPPADPATFSRRFAAMLAIPQRARDVMQENLEAKFRMRWTDLHIPSIARELATPALIVHDRDDADVPWSEGAAIAEAWPEAELLSTSGLGHRAVLRDGGVVRSTVTFLREALDELEEAGA